MLRTKKFWTDVVLATAFIFLFMWAASKFLGIFDFMDPIGDALGEFQLTDQVYSDPTFRQIPSADTNVVLVNIGHLSRGEIGQQISIISQYSPAAIGLDMRFRIRMADTLGDMILANAIANAENVVMYEKLIMPNADFIWTGSELSDPFFSVGIETASVNLVAEEAGALQHEAKTCRTIFPMEQLLDTVTQEITKVPAFSVKLAESLNPDAVARFIARGNGEEIVNYRGNIADMGSTAFGGRYFALDTYQVLNEDFTDDLIINKIVIFGFLGDYIGDPYTNEDKYFTPMNKKYTGRANPDMYGAVVHANAISMILNEDYIDKMSDMSSYVFAVLICIFNVALFSLIYRKLPRWYDGVTKLIQLTQFILLMFMLIMVFDKFDYQMTIDTALIVIALSGDSLEVYYGVLKNIFSKERRKELFTIRN